MSMFNNKKFLVLGFFLMPSFVIEAKAVVCKQMGHVSCTLQDVQHPDRQFSLDKPLLVNKVQCRLMESGKCGSDTPPDQLNRMCNSHYGADCISMSCVGMAVCEEQ